jgi:predicted phosphodiesterase
MKNAVIWATLLAACGVTSPGNQDQPDAMVMVGKGPIQGTGGTVPTLDFAIVGDTRPATEDDTAAYPTAVIARIWEDVEAESPRPDFGISTGDYMFASTTGTEAAKQLAVYIGARNHFENTVFAAMGNHECTGATASNCGQGNADGITRNFDEYRKAMLAPLGYSNPWYTIHINATDGSWTAKFVFIAGNYWTAAESTFLDTALKEKTTYTFVVRHENKSANEAPGVDPSETIIAKYPVTIVICGHTHTMYYSNSDGEVIVGNGGAPNTSSVGYGYVIAHRRTDGAIQFDDKDYDTGAVAKTFAVYADGTQAP